MEGLTGYQRERAVRDPEKAGAIWKIFHPSDNGKIRAAIEEWKRMRVLRFKVSSNSLHWRKLLGM